MAGQTVVRTVENQTLVSKQARCGKIMFDFPVTFLDLALGTRLDPELGLSDFEGFEDFWHDYT